jgi:hypothetical protein
MGEARPRLGLELVVRDVLRREGEGLVEVAHEVGGLLARDAVEQVDADVVKPGITKSVERAPDDVRTGPALERLEQVGAERLHPERDASDPAAPQRLGQPVRHRLRVRLDRDLVRAPEGREQPVELRQRGERRRAAPEEDRLEARREELPLEPELREQRVDVGRVGLAAAHDSDEVAVAAPVHAERQVHIEVPRAAHRFPSPRLSTARNASCGTSTEPTCFIRFLPAFCFSSSFRLRVMSPP